jgi:hypothetical protein
MFANRMPIEVVPPIVLDENGDVQAFPSVDSVTSYVEALDVLNNEYAFYDSTGRVLEAQVRKGKVSLIPTTKSESDSAVLRDHIVRVLSLLGVSDEAAARLPFTELSRLLLEKSKRRGP